MEMNEYSSLLRAPELEPHHPMQFSVIPRTPLLGRNVLSLYKGYSLHILNFINRAIYILWYITSFKKSQENF